GKRDEEDTERVPEVADPARPRRVRPGQPRLQPGDPTAAAGAPGAGRAGPGLTERAARPGPGGRRVGGGKGHRLKCGGAVANRSRRVVARTADDVRPRLRRTTPAATEPAERPAFRHPGDPGPRVPRGPGPR